MRIMLGKLAWSQWTHRIDDTANHSTLIVSLTFYLSLSLSFFSFFFIFSIKKKKKENRDSCVFVSQIHEGLYRRPVGRAAALLWLSTEMSTNLLFILFRRYTIERGNNSVNRKEKKRKKISKTRQTHQKSFVVRRTIKTHSVNTFATGDNRRNV